MCVKFGDLAPHQAFKNISGILIVQWAERSWQRWPGVNKLDELNLQIQASLDHQTANFISPPIFPLVW